MNNLDQAIDAVTEALANESGYWPLQTVRQAARIAVEAAAPHLHHCHVAPTGLFQRGDFTLHSGEKSGIKIDCDALSDEDIRTIAWMLVGRLPIFGSVEGIPQGGLRLADAIRPYASYGKVLIVDDVFTSGASMVAARGEREALGAVIFARRLPPPWIIPLLTLTPLPEVRP